VTGDGVGDGVDDMVVETVLVGCCVACEDAAGVGAERSSLLEPLEQPVIMTSAKPAVATRWRAATPQPAGGAEPPATS